VHTEQVHILEASLILSRQTPLVTTRNIASAAWHHAEFTKRNNSTAGSVRRRQLSNPNQQSSALDCATSLRILEQAWKRTYVGAHVVSCSPYHRVPRSCQSTCKLLRWHSSALTMPAVDRPQARLNRPDQDASANYLFQISCASYGSKGRVIRLQRFPVHRCLT
jgi:hypothetical protein